MTGQKRRQPDSPSFRAGRYRKLQKMEDKDEEIVYTPELGYEGDTPMEDEEVYDEEEDHKSDIYEKDEEEEEEEQGEKREQKEIYDEEDELMDAISNIHVRSFKSPDTSTTSYLYEEDDFEQDTTRVVSEEEYNRDSPDPNRRKIIRVPDEHSSRHVTTEELRSKGWNDDHIALIQKIAMRGFEPLLPEWWNMDYRYMPDELFTADDEAFICSVRDPNSRIAHAFGIKALNKLLELGGRARDCLITNYQPPELRIKKTLEGYIKWANRDADFDTKTAISLLAITIGAAETPASVLQENARRRLARLHTLYEEAFHAQHSIENTPSSTSTPLSYQVPQLYAIIASHTVIALVAYRPDLVNEEQVKPVAHFDMKDKDYDVWNALAIAILVCHLRNVQVRIADETGLGFTVRGTEVKEDDPDL